MRYATTWRGGNDRIARLMHEPLAYGLYGLLRCMRCDVHTHDVKARTYTALAALQKSHVPCPQTASTGIISCNKHHTCSLGSGMPGLSIDNHSAERSRGLCSLALSGCAAGGRPNLVRPLSFVPRSFVFSTLPTLLSPNRAACCASCKLGHSFK